MPLKKIRAFFYSLPIKKRLLLLIFLFIVFFISAVYGSKSGSLNSLIPHISGIEKPVFIKITFRFEDLPELLKKSGQESLYSQYSVKSFGNTTWVCDTSINKAYTSKPAVNMLSQPFLIRLLFDAGQQIDISSLKGIYECSAYVFEKPFDFEMSKVINIHVSSVRKLNPWLSKPVNKLVSFKPDLPSPEDKTAWMKYTLKYYPDDPKLPKFVQKHITAFSFPQNIPVYIATINEMKRCYKDGRIIETMLNNNILNKRHYKGKTPVNIPIILSPNYRQTYCLIYEIITTSGKIAGDGQDFQIVEELPGGFFRIVKGYYITVNNISDVNLLSCSLFLLKGLTLDELSGLIKQHGRFTLDKELFRLFIDPVLRQAKFEGANHNIPSNQCETIIESIGKLNIETPVNNYMFSITMRPDGKFSLKTNKRCTTLVLSDKDIIKKLPKFIFRQK